MTTTDRPLATGDALYRAIVADPDDDTARLVYADFLDGLPTTRKTCPTCKGEGNARAMPNGWPKWKPCTDCAGSGTVPDTAAADRAAFIRAQIELANIPATYRCCDCHTDDRPITLCRWCVLTRRERELRDRHSAEWSRATCPACGGAGKFVTMDTPTAYAHEPCAACGGSGDLLRVWNGEGESYVRRRGVLRPLTFARGFVESVTVPTLAECVRAVRLCRVCLEGRGVEEELNRFGYCGRCDANEPDGGPNTVTRPVPSPWLSAVVKAVPLRAVVPADRRPNGAPAAGWWSRRWGEGTPLEWWLPPVIYDTLEGGERGAHGQPVHNIYYPSPEAAVDALGRTLAAFGRSGSRG